MSKGILQVHPPICDCPGCRISSPVVREIHLLSHFVTAALSFYTCRVNVLTMRIYMKIIVLF